MFDNVIKHDKYFFVSTDSGDAPGTAGDAYGLYMGDTRIMSHYILRVDPGTLNVAVSSSRLGDAGRVVLLADELNSLESPPREVVVERRPLIRDGFIERIAITNYGSASCELRLTIEFSADFRDIFEVRGWPRPRRGEQFPPKIGDDGVRFHYRGLDEMDYVTDIRFSPVPTTIVHQKPHHGGNPGSAIVSGVRATYSLHLEPGSEFIIEVSVAAAIGAAPANSTSDPIPEFPLDRARLKFDPKPVRHAETFAASQRDWSDWLQRSSVLRTDNAAVNEVLDRSLRDVRMLLTDFGFGLLPTAGVPWYAAPFGRDSLITAMQMLNVRPDIAASTLRTLAHWQGARHDPDFDEAPGKIMHELRTGELARTREIPFVPYYGSVDATPLFIVAAGEYWRWTGDTALVRELLPALRSAARWLDEDGDLDGDGYIEYHRTKEGGLTNQGWKDSRDGIVHRDGRLAEGPIALAEVQGYVYLARRYFADMLDACGDAGDAEEAAQQRRRAERMRAAFNRDFWVEESGFYAMALDGQKQPVAAVSSNPGHCLWSGMIADDRVGAGARSLLMARRLLSDDMFTGYGVRTLSASEAPYHPLSYHRGTVWPHDNSLIAMGLARYGHGTAAARIAMGLFAAASFDRHRRLPELFGGYPADIDGPVWYPVACIPQAWAAAAPFLLIQAVLGLDPDIPNDRLTIAPHLPPGINRVELTNLKLGDRRVRIVVERRGHTDEFDWDVGVLSGRPLAIVANR